MYYLTRPRQTDIPIARDCNKLLYALLMLRDGHKIYAGKVPVKDKGVNSKAPGIPDLLESVLVVRGPCARKHSLLQTVISHCHMLLCLERNRRFLVRLGVSGMCTVRERTTLHDAAQNSHLLVYVVNSQHVVSRVVVFFQTNVNVGLERKLFSIHLTEVTARVCMRGCISQSPFAQNLLTQAQLCTPIRTTHRPTLGSPHHKMFSDSKTD